MAILACTALNSVEAILDVWNMISIAYALSSDPRAIDRVFL